MYGEDDMPMSLQNSLINLRKIAINHDRLSAIEKIVANKHVRTFQIYGTGGRN
jgi:hypothetical protein